MWDAATPTGRGTGGSRCRLDYPLRRLFHPPLGVIGQTVQGRRHLRRVRPIRGVPGEAAVEETVNLG
ncbi:hypothetical protein FBZ33_3810 [Micromonospora sp. A202]|nr:hypothetical protein FBZ33_3810 [Micromonospora sp. A202]